jgi:hypothetical protein|tara:strand:+ start:521 stop:754 length:234 start_codon:yes stop_codon:yes gene_type:complete
MEENLTRRNLLNEFKGFEREVRNAVQGWGNEYQKFKTKANYKRLDDESRKWIEKCGSSNKLFDDTRENLIQAIYRLE